MTVITDVATAKKIRLNIETSKKMMKEIRVREFDYTELGFEDERYRKDRVKRKNPDDDERYSSAIKQLTRGMDDETRMKERDQIIEEEQNANAYSVDAETEAMEVDFIPHPYYKLDDKPQVAAPELNAVQPVNYWHNDDGFWDEYKAYKHSRMEQAGYLTNRKFFHH